MELAAKVQRHEKIALLDICEIDPTAQSRREPEIVTFFRVE